jgi:hypothetical protein
MSFQLYPAGGDKAQWDNLYVLETAVENITAGQNTSALSFADAHPRNVFLRHSGVLAPRAQFYDSSKDVHKHYMGITFVPQDKSAVPQRGWDLVLCYTEPSTICLNGESLKVVNVVYLKPLRHNQSSGRPQWKEPFLGHTFVPMLRPPRFTHVYQETLLPVKHIAFSFEPAGSIGTGRDASYLDARLKIPKKLHGTVQHIITTISDFMKKHSSSEQESLLTNGVSVLPSVNQIPQDGDGEDDD